MSFSSILSFAAVAAGVAVVRAEEARVAASRSLLDAGYGYGYGETDGSDIETVPASVLSPGDDTSAEDDTSSASVLVAGAVVAGVVAALAGVAGVMYRRHQAAALPADTGAKADV